MSKRVFNETAFREGVKEVLKFSLATQFRLQFKKGRIGVRVSLSVPILVDESRWLTQDRVVLTKILNAVSLTPEQLCRTEGMMLAKSVLKAWREEVTKNRVECPPNVL